MKSWTCGTWQCSGGRAGGTATAAPMRRSTAYAWTWPPWKPSGWPMRWRREVRSNHQGSTAAWERAHFTTGKGRRRMEGRKAATRPAARPIGACPVAGPLVPSSRQQIRGGWGWVLGEKMGGGTAIFHPHWLPQQLGGTDMLPHTFWAVFRAIIRGQVCWYCGHFACEHECDYGPGACLHTLWTESKGRTIPAGSCGCEDFQPLSWRGKLRSL